MAAAQRLLDNAAFIRSCIDLSGEACASRILSCKRMYTCANMSKSD